MDIDLFRDGEQFSTFDSHKFLEPYPEESTSLDGIQNFEENKLYDWDLTHERELNGDVGLIPSTSTCETMNIDKISESPPTKEDFQKIMNDWQQFINMDFGCEDFHIEDPIIAPEENENQAVEQKHSLHELLTLPSNNTFDITMYLNEEEPKEVQSIPVRKPRAGVKKIDIKAQRYIVEEDDADVDVETVSECESSPVLEAGDLNSLLEQFEATQLPQVAPNEVLEPEIGQLHIKQEPLEIFDEDVCTDDSNVKCKPEVVKIKQEFMGKEVVKIKKEVEIEVKKEPRNGCHAKRKEREAETQEEICRVKDKKIIKMEPTEFKVETKPLIISNEPPTGQYAVKPEPTPTTAPKVAIPEPSSKHKMPPAVQPQQPASKTQQTAHKSESTTSAPPDPAKNRQIIESLPRELIDRIKESGKRKPISVIPPIPTKRRGGPRTQETGVPPGRGRPVKPASSSETVQLDHDYCSSNGSFPEQQKKDSGFESAEEDDRAIMRKQPMVKNADGKLMVSLLKVNTIHTATETNQKRKLNLEEYKKRREGFLKSQSSSQNCSPVSSACSSPVPEDENTRILKHQEKLMRMAKEVLNTPPKSERKPEVIPVIAPIVQPVKIPSNMVKKTLVSIGINTDFKICKNIDPMAPVEQLEEIKPLLKKASAKINCNSLITSLIENIPKVMSQSESKARQQEEVKEHGEDKTIVYLPKDRAALKTSDAGVQTNISLIQQCKQSRYRRRRNTSSSSNSSSDSRQSRASTSRYNRGRKTSSSSGSSSSRSSHSSRSESFSSYSSRSPSRSRSRSSSPRFSRKERDRERLREVEERRVIYVGRISSITTREDLRKRFQRFGAITNISLHFRDHGYLDNYGFVTFANKLDAYEAIEHGNDDPYQPKYDLSFGGRRIFCKTSYSDLDNMRDESTYFPPRVVEDSFDTLLREAQEKLRKRKA